MPVLLIVLTPLILKLPAGANSLRNVIIRHKTTQGAHIPEER